MASSGKDDNSSQFFFTLNRADELNGKHTLFGKVKEREKEREGARYTCMQTDRQTHMQIEGRSENARIQSGGAIH